MPISIQCTKCGRGFKVRDELAGKRVKCPCGEAFVVPAPSPVAELLDEEFAIQDEPPVAAAKTPAPPRSHPQPSAAAPTGALLRPTGKRRTVSGRNTKLVIGISIAAASLVVAIALALVFWGGGSGAVITEFYATPEEAFEAHKAATLAKDWRKVLAAMTPESQDRMVASAAWWAVEMARTDQEMARLLDDYGVSPAQPRAGDLGEMISQVQERKRLVSSLDDKPAFYAAVVDRQHELLKEHMEEQFGTAQVHHITVIQTGATLRDVQIEGDWAEGRYSESFAGRTTDVPVRFRRIDGGWLVHLPSMHMVPLGGAARVPATTIREEAALERLQKLGAKAHRDGSGRPYQVVFPPSSADLDAALALLKDLPMVQEVFLNQTGITDAKLEHLKQLPNLRHLDLDRTKITDAGLSHLKELTSLGAVSLRSTQVTGTGLTGWGQLTRLSTLYLTDTPFTDEGMSHVARLGSLETLVLSGTRVTDAGVAQLKGLKNLEVLDLSKTRVTDAGLAHLKDLTGLTYLGINNTAITDAGLASIEGLTNLRRLMLDGTRVTDTGLEYVKAFTALNVLELRNTPVTNAGVKRIQEALPRCKIYTQ